jgi:hypothetical protein
MPRKNKTKPLFSEDEAIRFAEFIDSHIGQADFAVDKLRSCRNKDNMSFVDPTLKYWESVCGGLKLLRHNLRIIGTDSQ